MLRPGSMTGIVAVDREAMTVTAAAGTRLKHLNAGLEHLGLSLHNMGDIAEQTLAGAISTGTHGTGGVAAGLAAQVVGLELVTGTGEVLRATAEENPNVLEMARVGLGALGILTTVTFAVEPLFVLGAHERRVSFDEVLGSFSDLVEKHHHVDVHWFPHTDAALLKTNDRLLLSTEDADPLPGWRRGLEDGFLHNEVLGSVFALLARVPAATPRTNRALTTLISERSYSDVAHRVFVSRRSFVFREMEYALPAAAGMPALREVRRLIDASEWRIPIPVEVRYAPADDIPLSTAYDRDTVYLAFHTPRRADHVRYFHGVEQIMRAHDGRPHWGKLHTRDSRAFAELYPRFGDFLAMRDRLDPDRVFANAYLRRVLGD
jgi:FAD-linked oxidoreductase